MLKTTALPLDILSIFKTQGQWQAANSTWKQFRLILRHVKGEHRYCFLKVRLHSLKNTYTVSPFRRVSERKQASDLSVSRLATGKYLQDINVREQTQKDPITGKKSKPRL